MGSGHGIFVSALVPWIWVLGLEIGVLVQMLLNQFLKYIQGVPKKTVILGKMLIAGLGRGLGIKVGYVLINSGNFQSNEHINFVF